MRSKTRIRNKQDSKHPNHQKQFTAIVSPAVLIDEKASIRILTICNPDRRNALDPEILQQLRDQITLSLKDRIRCLVVTGYGEKAFCAGMDLNVLANAAPKERIEILDELEATLAAFESGPPVVAYLNGVSYGGGCELACACDFRIARQGIELCIPSARLGIVYSSEGIERISRIVGVSRARQMLLSGMSLDPEKALSWGLLDEVLPKNRGFDRALKLASSLAANSLSSQIGTKRVFAALSQLDRKARLHAKKLQKSSFAGPDAAEAFSAFLKKRPPAF